MAGRGRPSRLPLLLHIGLPLSRGPAALWPRLRCVPINRRYAGVIVVVVVVLLLLLVLELGLMFLAFGGVIAVQDGMLDEAIIGALATLTAFIVLMGLGVWHVFRKRGRIYI
mgnify:CR=1 FL=1